MHGKEVMDLRAAWGAIPGVLALAGVAVTYGRMTQRLKDVEDCLFGATGVRAKVEDMRTAVEVVRSQLGSTDDKVDRIEGQVNKLVDRLIDGGHR